MKFTFDGMSQETLKTDNEKTENVTTIKEEDANAIKENEEKQKQQQQGSKKRTLILNILFIKLFSQIIKLTVNWLKYVN